ncbi:unnamed protein product, partial [Mesorhabditis belari]|uniref:Uncharacterized protein n=1 Tax=Mesorhabditis belari TaxID=2138241 RepID=A0AAF3FQ63_9BILA
MHRNRDKEILWENVLSESPRYLQGNFQITRFLGTLARKLNSQLQCGKCPSEENQIFLQIERYPAICGVSKREVIGPKHVESTSDELAKKFVDFGVIPEETLKVIRGENVENQHSFELSEALDFLTDLLAPVIEDCLSDEKLIVNFFNGERENFKKEIATNQKKLWKRLNEEEIPINCRHFIPKSVAQESVQNIFNNKLPLSQNSWQHLSEAKRLINPSASQNVESFRLPNQIHMIQSKEATIQAKIYELEEEKDLDFDALTIDELRAVLPKIDKNTKKWYIGKKEQRQQLCWTTSVPSCVLSSRCSTRWKNDSRVELNYLNEMKNLNVIPKMLVPFFMRKRYVPYLFKNLQKLMFEIRRESNDFLRKNPNGRCELDEETLKCVKHRKASSHDEICSKLGRRIAATTWNFWHNEPICLPSNVPLPKINNNDKTQCRISFINEESNPRNANVLTDRFISPLSKDKLNSTSQINKRKSSSPQRDPIKRPTYRWVTPEWKVPLDEIPLPEGIPPRTVERAQSAKLSAPEPVVPESPPPAQEPQPIYNHSLVKEEVNSAEDGFVEEPQLLLEEETEVENDGENRDEAIVDELSQVPNIFPLTKKFLRLLGKQCGRTVITFSEVDEDNLWTVSVSFSEIHPNLFSGCAIDEDVSVAELKAYHSLLETLADDRIVPRELVPCIQHCADWGPPLAKQIALLFDFVINIYATINSDAMYAPERVHKAIYEYSSEYWRKTSLALPAEIELPEYSSILSKPENAKNLVMLVSAPPIVQQPKVDPESIHNFSNSSNSFASISWE